MVEPIGEPNFLSRRRRVVGASACGPRGELRRLRRIVMDAEMLVVRDRIEIGIDPLRKRSRISDVLAPLRKPPGERGVEHRA